MVGNVYVVSTTGAIPVFANDQLLLSANPTVVAILTDTHRKVNFYNLPTGQVFYLSVVSFNSTGIAVPSQPVLIKVL